VTAKTPPLEPEALDRVVIRFAGDSGDGMQLVGDRFTDISAVFGNDLATMPNYPAEIRAPAGTIAGVSSCQVHSSDHEILTPGDMPNVLVAMNPAALRANVTELEPGGTLLVNSDAFEQRNLEKAGYQASPLEDGSLGAFRVIQVPMTTITLEATKPLGVKPRDAERSKNFFALGLLTWMYTRPVDPTLQWIDDKFGQREMVHAANLAAFKAGYNFGETAELFDHPYEVAPARLEPGRYRNITGNLALSLGLVAAAQQSKLPLLYASYPITPP
jgi:2-oxoglutarate ferredoxin oxidoreductase subunit alpha